MALAVIVFNLFKRERAYETSQFNKKLDSYQRVCLIT